MDNKVLKSLSLIARCIFIIGVPALLTSSSIGWGFKSLWLYEYGFQKYDVSQTTGLAPVELSKTAAGLIRYFNSSDEYISITVTKDGKPFQLFTREEAIHFKDVKALVRLDYTVLLISFLYVLGYALVSLFRRKPKHWRSLAKSVLWGSGITLALMLLAGIGAALNFDQLFLQFHFLAFTNPYWSAQGYMLLLFPGGFWYDAAVICAAFTGAMAVVLAGVSIAYLRRAGKTHA